ncbi:MAG: hypothetical protein AWU57_538 [Marinobacter sp. T13-3]|nr:MAG: hypothetical protein AWU57_538 [Marinobacter sp. T13-3]
MGEYSFRCAKSQTSIPIPRATPRPEEHCLVTLYLPEGQVVSGELTGYGEIVVGNAYTRGPNGEERPIAGDILDHPWLANAGGDILNIYGATGLQLFKDCRDTGDVLNRMMHSEADGDALEASVKLVRASHYDPADRYETLPASDRCPWQGRDFPSPRAFVEHVYQGNATQAYLDLYDHAVTLNLEQMPPSSDDARSLTPKQQVAAAHDRAMDSTIGYIMAMLRPEEAEWLMNREVTLTELLDDEAFIDSMADRFPGLDMADFGPEGVLNLEHADLALMMAMDDPDRRATLAAYAQPNEPSGPRLG